LENLKEENHFTDRVVDGRIILKQILKLAASAYSPHPSAAEGSQ
jgi:hypothetical protein